MDKDRLIAFTDAILAIIMTILVLELQEPETLSLQGLWALKGSYSAYTLSFFWLGTMWIGLHNEWQNVRKNIHTGHLVQPVHPLLLIALSLCDENRQQPFR